MEGKRAARRALSSRRPRRRPSTALRGPRRGGPRVTSTTTYLLTTNCSYLLWRSYLKMGQDFDYVEVSLKTAA